MTQSVKVSNKTIANQEKRFLKNADICQLYGVARSTLNLWVKNGLFPQPTRITCRFVGWRTEEVEQFFSGKNDPLETHKKYASVSPNLGGA